MDHLQGTLECLSTCTSDLECLELPHQLSHCGSVHRLVVRLDHEVGNIIVWVRICPSWITCRTQARIVSICFARAWCRGLSQACFVAVASKSIVVGMSLLIGCHESGRKSISSREAIAFKAIPVTPPSSPSMDDRQSFQNRVSHKITAPERNKQYPMQVRRSSMSVVAQSASEYPYIKGAGVSAMRE